MTVATKIKVSVSIGADVLGAVDGQAAREGTTRSAVIERWLRQTSRTNAANRLAEDTAAYYDGLTDPDKQDDAAWSAASSAAARRLRIDDQSPDPTKKEPPSSRSRRARRA